MEIPRVLIWTVLLLFFGAIMAEATNYVVINRIETGNASSTNTTAENVYPGTFGLTYGGGNYTFTNLLDVNTLMVTNGGVNATFAGDVTIDKRLYVDNINVANISADRVRSDYLIADTVLTLMPGGILNLPDNSVTNQFINSLDASKLYNLSQLNYKILVNGSNITGGVPYSILVGTASAYCPGNSVVANVTLLNDTILLDCLSVGTGNLTGSGDTPYVPYFTSSINLQPSPIYVESSDRVVVNGTANFTGTQVNTTFVGDVQIIGKLYGGSPVKIAGGLEVVTGNANFTDIYVTNCFGCAIINGTTINATNITAQNFIALESLTVNEGGNISFPNQSLPLSVLYGTTNASCPSGEFQTQTTFTNGTITVGCASPMINITDVVASGPYLYNITLGNTNTFYFNETQLNQTINALINQFNQTIPTYNESGIARNYTLLGSASGTLPDWDMITIKGVITTTGNSSLLLNFNGDTNFNYTYRRVQGLVWLYQAVTVNPQRNITLEQYQSNRERDILIRVYRTGTSISGEFEITAYVTDSYGPYKTMGSFTYKNSSSVNTFSIAPSVTSGSYLIVTSERK